MPVYADFERKYQFAPEPWDTGAAAAEHYDTLFQFIAELKPHSKVGLDLGCGEGAFTARLATLCEKMCAFDISPTAIQRAKEQYQNINFFTAALRSLAGLQFEDSTFDLIVVSQVLSHIKWAEAAEILAQIERLLTPGGLLCLAANCMGGNYFTLQEFRALIAGQFDIVGEREFERHLFLAATRRPLEVVLTVNYEVAEHDGPKTLDPLRWQTQVLDPCAQLMSLCEEFGAKLTIMVEVCQYWFVERYLPEVAGQIREQLKESVQRGHDVQVHMHTRWLPELGARVHEASGKIHLNMNQLRLHDLSPEQLEALLRRAKAFLEGLLSPVRVGYKAIVFRAGKYQIQPHQPIFAALAAAGYKADSSVWHGGFLSSYDRRPGYGFRSLWTTSKPYWPSAHDICVPATDADAIPAIMELPILARDGEQWALDRTQRADALLKLWQQLSGGGGPRVMISQTKEVTPRVLDNLRWLLSELARNPLVTFLKLQEVTEKWYDRSYDDSYQIVQREYMWRSIPAPEELWQRLPAYNRRKVNLFVDHIQQLARRQDVVRVLDVGCGTGELVTIPLRYRLQSLSNVQIHGVDIDPASIGRAAESVSTHSVGGISFEVKRIEELSDAFDCIICTEVIEHLDDPASFLAVLRPAVVDNGMLLLSTPNGYGYKEIERRVLYYMFDVAQRMPAWARMKLQAVYRFLKRRLSPRLRSNGNAPQNNHQPQPIRGTLNFQRDIHVQFFSIGRLRYLLQSADFEVEQVSNVQLLGGVVGTLLERKFDLNRLLDVTPHRLAAAWVLVARPRRIS